MFLNLGFIFSNILFYFFFFFFFLIVEQQGIEPWSKHGIHMLSTCLAFCCFSTMVRKKAPKPSLILLNFRLSPKVG